MRGAVVAVAAVTALVLLQAPVVDPVERALDALHAHGARDETVLEAVVAAGRDPRHWRGVDLLAHVSVPAPGEDPVVPLREAYAVLSAGADPRAWDDPVRGSVDLWQDLLDNAPAALASTNDAAQSWQLLAMAAAMAGGAPAEEAAETVAVLRARLLSLQSPGGAWGCGPWHGPECTGFALAALSATGGVPAEAAERAARAILSWHSGAAFSDPRGGPDVQVTAWAVQGLRLAGQPAPAATTVWILGQQRPDGMWTSGGRASTWATAEVVVMLSGGHPLVRP